MIGTVNLLVRDEVKWEIAVEAGVPLEEMCRAAFEAWMERVASSAFSNGECICE